MTQDLPAPRWIDTPAALKAMLPDLNRWRQLAVDTEANSLHAYRERVCLIQFSTPEIDYLVDPIKIHDLTLLGDVFANPHVEKIFHASEYDIIGLQRDYSFTFANIFDTMIAARTLGYKNIGLGNLLAEKFDIQLNKQYQKADWGQRPLPPPLIDYARLDTHYLFQLRTQLEIELHEKGRWELAQEDFLRCCHVNGNHRDLRERWERINGSQDLTPRERTILHELCIGREKIAEKLDRPLFKVLDDRILVTLAQKAPHSMAELKQAGMSDRQVERFGRSLLEAIRRGETAHLVTSTDVERQPEAVLNRLRKLKQWRKNAAEKLDVESDIILSKMHMHLIAEQDPQTAEELARIMVDSPWRFAQYGTEILKTIGHKQEAEKIDH